MLRARPRLALLLVVALVGACGGDGESGGVEMFDESGIGLTFEYPAAFEKRDDFGATVTAGARPAEETAVMLDDENGIVVAKYVLNITVDEQNIDDIKPEIDALAAQVAGTSVETEQIELAGLPGFRFEADVEKPKNGRSRIAILSDGQTEYTLNCGSTPEKRAEIEAACERAFETLEQK